MFSAIKKGFLYTDISSDITEHDLNIVADTWNMDGREVYRGTLDTRYTHANVHWLYDDNLERVGCVEHSLKDHSDLRVLWFRESEFGTLLQEDWKEDDDLWSKLPRHVFDRFLNEGWTTPAQFLEHCLQGSVRIVTPSMLVIRPVVYTCTQCGRKSLTQQDGCTNVPQYLDYPDKKKVFFVDFDFVVHIPPSDSVVWSILQPQRDADSLREPEQAPEQEQESPLQTEPIPPLAQDTHPSQSPEQVQQ